MYMEKFKIGPIDYKNKVVEEVEEPEVVEPDEDEDINLDEDEI